MSAAEISIFCSVIMKTSCRASELRSFLFTRRLSICKRFPSISQCTRVEGPGRTYQGRRLVRRASAQMDEDGQSGSKSEPEYLIKASRCNCRGWNNMSAANARGCADLFFFCPAAGDRDTSGNYCGGQSGGIIIEILRCYAALFGAEGSR